MSPRLNFHRIARLTCTRISRLASFGEDRVDTVEAVTKAAERLTGMDRSAFTVRGKVLGKNRRALLRLHTIVPVPGMRSGGRKPPRLVEKRHAEPHEYRFYRSLGQAEPAARPAPLLHAAWDHGLLARDPRRYTVLIDYVEERGIPDRSQSAARDLADSISEISTLSPVGAPKRRRSNHLSRGLLGRFLKLAHRGGQFDHPPTLEALEAMRRDWRLVSGRRRFRLPCCPAHNDLHEENICRLPHEEGGRFIFLDWEMFGLNYVGADLHYLLHRTITEPSFAEFYGWLRERYCERIRAMHAVDADTIDLGAHVYALRRSMGRAVLGGDIAEIAVALQLFARLKQFVAMRA